MTAPPRRRPIGAAAAVVLALAAGCAPDGGTAEQQGARDEVYDPPTEFDAEAGVPIDLGEHHGTGMPAFDAGTVFVADAEGVHARDGLREQEEWSVEVSRMARGVRPDAAAVTELDGRTAVVAAFSTIAGEGGAAHRIEVVAVDADSGEELWRTEEPVDGPAPDPADVQAIGAGGGSVVVSYGGTYAFSAADGALLWSDPELRPAAVESGAVVGWSTGEGSAAPGALLARDAGDGAELWELWEGAGDTARPVHAAPLDDGLVLVARRDGSGEGTLDTLDGVSERGTDPGAAPAPTPSARAGTGPAPVEWAAVDTADGTVAYWPDPVEDQFCRYDEQSLLVCWTTGSSPSAQVYTAATGDRLWREDGLGGGGPMAVRGVWHGVVYTDKGVGGSGSGILSLDFQDELDLDPQVAPDATDGIIGLRLHGDGTLTSYPAVS